VHPDSIGANAVSTHIVGNEIFSTVSASLLPSKGLAFKDYTWTVWSIDSRVTGLGRLDDFAPNANIGVTAVPEPETYALFGAGLGLMGLVARRRARGVARPSPPDQAAIFSCSATVSASSFSALRTAGRASTRAFHAIRFCRWPIWAPERSCHIVAQT